MRNLIRKVFDRISKADISVLFFLMFIFCLPLFKKLNMYSNFSFQDGRFVDYLTYSVYVFDFFILFAFIAWAVEILVKKEEPIIGSWKINLAYFAILIISFISTIFSTDRMISLYYIFVLIILFALFIFTFNKLRNKNHLFLFLNTFVLTMTLQSIIALVQFIKNSSIGLSRIGEQVLSPKIAGVAKIMFGSIKHIRPYGTFSHPNILALFLVIGGIIILHLIFKSRDKVYKLFLYACATLVGFALFLTFSRILWVLGFIAFLIMIFKHFNFRFKKMIRSWPWIILSILAISGVIYYFIPAIIWRINPFDPIFWQSFNDRAIIFGKAWIMIRSHFFGIGIGNFVIEEVYLLTGYPLWMAEPVHNTYLLVLAEIGWLGLASFLSFIYFVGRILRKAPIYLILIFAVLTSYMFFDHCFWDIRQAQVLLMMFFGLICVYNLSNNR